MTKKNKTFLILALLILAGALLVLVKLNYKKQQEPAQSSRSQATTTNTSTVTNESRASSAPRPGVEFESYPADLPKDLQVIPAFFDQSLIVKAPEGKEIVSVTYTTQNPQKAMVDVFKTFLTRAEWQIHSQTLPDKSEQLSVTKGAQRADITVKSLDNSSSQVFLLYYR